MKEEKARLTFYAAECMEFTCLGAYVECETLGKAVQAYTKLKKGKRGMGAGIGFELHDSKEPDYSEIPFPLYQHGCVDEESIKLVDVFWGHPLIQDAICKMKDYDLQLNSRKEKQHSQER